MLSDLFLEPISVTEIDYYLDKSDISVSDLILIHKHEKQERFVSVLMAWEISLKHINRDLKIKEKATGEAEYLISLFGHEEDYLKIYNPNEEYGSLIKFKKFLQGLGFGEELDAMQLEKLLKSKNTSDKIELHNILERVFFRRLPINAVDVLKRWLEKHSVAELLQKHSERPELTFLCIMGHR
jgi:hypothetical protein